MSAEVFQSPEGQPGLDVQDGAGSRLTADAGRRLAAQPSRPREHVASPAQQSQSGWVSHAMLGPPAASVLREPVRICLTFWKGHQSHFSRNVLVISYDSPLGVSESSD